MDHETRRQNQELERKDNKMEILSSSRQGAAPGSKIPHSWGKPRSLRRPHSQRRQIFDGTTVRKEENRREPEREREERGERRIGREGEMKERERGEGGGPNALNGQGGSPRDTCPLPPLPPPRLGRYKGAGEVARNYHLPIHCLRFDQSCDLRTHHNNRNNESPIPVKIHHSWDISSPFWRSLLASTVSRE